MRKQARIGARNAVFIILIGVFNMAEYKIPEYQECLDWDHCKDIVEAQKRLSQITNLLNKLIMISAQSEKDIILQIAEFGSEIPEKLSTTNKIIKLAILNENSPEIKQLISVYYDSDSARKQLALKREAIIEDLMALKRIEDIRGRHG